MLKHLSNKFLLIVLVTYLLYPDTALPVKVYKWVDEKGNITYLDRPPPEENGQVEKKEIDPDKNVIKYKIPKSSGGTSTPGSTSGSTASPDGAESDGRDNRRTIGGSAKGEPSNIPPPPYTPVPGVTPPPSPTPPPTPTAPPPAGGS